MQIGDADEVELTAAVFICPHCKTAGAITEMGGEEWCNGCGLDPNILSYPAPTLVHLWEPGSGIMRMMQRGVAMLRPDHSMGEFLRTYCGPHCSYAKICPQTVRNFITCFKEECPNTPIGEEMSRKSKKTRKQRKKERREEHEAVLRASKRALVECSRDSWFEKVLYANSPYPEQTGDTGSGSGT
jgi:hypothetical protein